MFVYLIRNTVDGKGYVGQTTKTLSARWKRHIWPSTAGTEIAKAISDLGAKAFTCSVLEECSSSGQLLERELFWAQKLGTFYPDGYNLRAGAGPGAMSVELKRRIAKGNLGQKRSDETRRRLSESHLGIRLSDSAKRKLSEANKGKRPSNLAQINCANRMEYTLVSPDGTMVTFRNMRAHCRVNGLSPSKMSELVRGKRDVVRGWRLP